MTNLGLSKKIVDFVYHLVGHFPGGLPAAAVITCAIFGALSGSAVATVIAVGVMLIPQMLQLGYSKENSMGVVVASGTLGSMIPPSVVMILYAAMVQINVSDLFIAGIIPGIFLASVLIITSIIINFRESAIRKDRSSFSQIIKSFIQAIPSLLMPVIVLGGIYAGYFTPTEAAAIAVFYVILVSYLFHRKEFTKANFMSSFKGTMITTTVIYLILGAATLFSTSLTFANVPQRITGFVADLSVANWLVMLAIVLLFLILGAILDSAPILFVALPILYPTVLALGYDPIHFAVITVATLMIGQITPPIGMSLFAISGHFKENITVVVRGMFPYLIALIIGTIILVFVPWLSTALVK